jgi:hypothetical protein
MFILNGCLKYLFSRQDISMSNELVPLSYARDAYNSQHGAVLEHHADNVTAEQATSINNHFDVEVALGTHGLRTAQDAGLKERAYRPSDLEYDEAARVVAAMEPGDTLLVEGYGFTAKEIASGFGAKTHSHEAAPASDLESSVERLMMTLSKGFSEDAVKDKHEFGTAWEYAEALASFKGVRVVRADYDAFDKEQLLALTGGRDLDELMYSRDPEDQRIAKQVNEWRGRRAAAALKDDALTRLSSNAMPAPGSRKPKLVLLFGSGHEEDITRAFHDMGLDARFNRLQSTSYPERLGKVVLQDMNDMATQVKPLL